MLGGLRSDIIVIKFYPLLVGMVELGDRVGHITGNLTVNNKIVNSKIITAFNGVVYN